MTPKKKCEATVCTQYAPSPTSWGDFHLCSCLGCSNMSWKIFGGCCKRLCKLYFNILHSFMVCTRQEHMVSKVCDSYVEDTTKRVVLCWEYRKEKYRVTNWPLASRDLQCFKLPIMVIREEKHRVKTLIMSSAMRAKKKKKVFIDYYRTIQWQKSMLLQDFQLLF